MQKLKNAKHMTRRPAPTHRRYWGGGNVLKTEEKVGFIADCISKEQAQDGSFPCYVMEVNATKSPCMFDYY